MSQKWNLQDIRPAGGHSPRRKRMRPPVEMETETAEENEEETTSPVYDTEPADHVPINNGNSRNRNRLIVMVIAFLVIIAGGFFASALMSGAEVTVHPRYKDVTVQATFLASKTPKSDQLTYELLSLQREGEAQVEASGQETVQEQATGEIIIHKKTSGAQPLIKNTRFETPDGLIFKLFESIIVPGAVENAEGELVEGTINARVFAESVGEEYNVEPTTFTVPGLKNDTALFAAIGATSNDAFTGGFDGEQFIIVDDELETAKQALHTRLRDELLAEVEKARPAGFELYENAITFTFESLPSVKYSDDLATIKEKATMRVPLFKSDEFAEFIAESTVAGYEGNPVRLDVPEDLSFSYSIATTSVSDISTKNELSFNLRGNTRVVWTFDSEQLKADLLNVTKNGLNTVLSGYPAIEEAEAVIKPFWKRSFPTDMAEIIVIEEILEE